tara:strand:+ start:986 stop:1603 length:618 start_codon:yes stop_codon:yes gene_type:complete
MATKYLPFLMLGCVACSSSSLLGFLMMNSSEDPATGPTTPKVPKVPKVPYPGYVSGRYVRLALPVATENKYPLALHDIRVYDEDGDNIATTAKGASVTASGSNNGSPEDAIDGERYSTFWISDHSEGLRYFEIDLGSVKNIVKIEISDLTGTGVYSGLIANQRMRLGEAYIEIKDASDARVVKSEPIPHDGGRYFLSFENKTPTW